MGIANALQNRPVRVLGFIAAIHAMVYGIGISLGTGGYGETVLYTALGTEPVIYGFSAALLVTGILLAYAYSKNNPKTIYYASALCGTVWLFAAITYLLNAAWLLAIGIGLPWAVLAYYLAYAHSNRQNILFYDQSPDAIQDTKDENIRNNTPDQNVR